jgi:hypothetical protein
VGVNSASIFDDAGDSLTGGNGRDRFVLGDTSRVYYDDGIPDQSGEFVYARITDFTVGQDTIQLKGNASFYSLDFFIEAGVQKAVLIYDTGAEMRGEIVGILENVSTSLSVTSASFAYV